MELPIENFIQLKDINKGFEGAISKGHFAIAKLYLEDILDLTSNLIDKYPDLQYLDYSTGLEYTDSKGELQRVDFNLFCEYRDFSIEMLLMIDETIYNN